jgi:hypothetical protein
MLSGAVTVKQAGKERGEMRGGREFEMKTSESIRITDCTVSMLVDFDSLQVLGLR